MFWFYYQTDPCQCLVYLSGTFCILTCTSHHSSFCECWALVFIVLFFFLRKKRLCFCFHYFHVAGLVHLWNGQFLLSVTSSTPISVYEFIWQLEGCFYSFMSLIFSIAGYFCCSFTIFFIFYVVLQFS